MNEKLKLLSSQFMSEKNQLKAFILAQVIIKDMRGYINKTGVFVWGLYPIEKKNNQ